MASIEHELVRGGDDEGGDWQALDAALAARDPANPQSSPADRAARPADAPDPDGLTAEVARLRAAIDRHIERAAREDYAVMFGPSSDRGGPAWAALPEAERTVYRAAAVADFWRDDPQSEGERLLALDRSALTDAAAALQRSWEALCRCTDEFLPEHPGACDEREQELYGAVERVIAARRGGAGLGDAG